MCPTLFATISQNLELIKGMNPFGYSLGVLLLLIRNEIMSTVIVDLRIFKIPQQHYHESTSNHPLPSFLPFLTSSFFSSCLSLYHPYNTTPSFVHSKIVHMASRVKQLYKQVRLMRIWLFWLPFVVLGKFI